jgi:hypothetical protein
MSQTRQSMQRISACPCILIMADSKSLRTCSITDFKEVIYLFSPLKGKVRLQFGFYLQGNAFYHHYKYAASDVWRIVDRDSMLIILYMFLYYLHITSKSWVFIIFILCYVP